VGCDAASAEQGFGYADFHHAHVGDHGRLGFDGGDAKINRAGTETHGFGNLGVTLGTHDAADHVAFSGRKSIQLRQAGFNDLDAAPVNLVWE
jgi:hypothetical protein